MDVNIYDEIYEIVRAIPEGRVTSYGAIAQCLSKVVSPRMVGYAMSLSHPVHPFVPAHRVVNRVGVLTGRHHFSDPDEMQRRLEAEGIQVIEHQIKDFEKIFWNPKEIINKF